LDWLQFPQHTDAHTSQKTVAVIHQAADNESMYERLNCVANIAHIVTAAVESNTSWRLHCPIADVFRSRLFVTGFSLSPVSAHPLFCVSCFRHCRPQNAPASPRGVVWRQRHGAQMVYLVSQRSITRCSLQVIINASQGRPVQCPARVGLGTDPLSTIYSTPAWSN